MAQKLVSIMIDEELYKNLKSRCIPKDIKIKWFIADAIKEKLYDTTSRTTKRIK
jgi:hypothetical protein